MLLMMALAKVVTPCSQPPPHPDDHCLDTVPTWQADSRE